MACNDAHRVRNRGASEPARSTPRARLTGTCLAAALAMSPSAARASGFLNPRIADPHGHPALANPYAVYFNPAALGGIHGTEIVADGTLAFRTVDYERAESALSPQSPETRSDPLYRAANTGAAHAGNVAVIPFIAAASDFGTRRFFAGVGAYVPFGGAVNFDQRDEFAGNAARGAVDGAQRWAVVSGTQRSLYNTAAVGVRWPEIGLSLGVSGSLVLSQIVHGQARNLAGNDEVVSEGRALLDVSSMQASATVGVHWEILPRRLFFGASYAIRPGFGEMRMSGRLRQRYGTDNADKDVDLVQTFPDVLRMGIAARPWGREVELRLEGELVPWSVFDRQCIVLKGQPCKVGPDGAEINSPSGQIVLNIHRGWRNAGAVRAGVGYFLNERTELHGGLGYDTSAVPTSTLESTYPDAFKLIGSLGVRHRVSDAVALGASYTHVYYLPTTTGPQRQAALAGASKVPNEDGEYQSQVMFVNLNATFSF